MNRYRLRRNDNSYGSPEVLTDTLSVIRSILERQGPKFRIQRGLAPPGPWRRNRLLTLARITTALTLSNGGDTLRVETKDGNGTRIAVRTVPVPNVLLNYRGDPVNLAEGNPRIAKVGQWTADHFPRARSAGYAYTRKVAGTTVWSQHSRFDTGTNALDIAFYKGDKPSGGIDVPALVDYVSSLVAASRAGHLKTRRIIFQDRDYRRENDYRPTKYTGIYHSSHAHVEGEPKQEGTPVDAPK